MGALSPASVLYDAEGHPVGVVLDGSIYRLQMQAKVLNSSGTEIDPATEGTLDAIKDTDGIKKITDPLPAGTNNIGDVDLASPIPAGTNEIGKVAQGTKAAGSAAWSMVLYDSDGHPVGVIFDGSIYRLRVESKITDGTNVLGIDSQNAVYVSGKSAIGSILLSNPVAVSGVDSAGQKRSFRLDDAGRLIVANSGVAAPDSGFIFGAVPTSGSAVIRIEGTTYTEQISGAQRSLVSASASDSSSGIGARKIRITYLKSDFSGPFTDEVTLNGTTAVDTNVSDICYIEKMEVIETGSNGTNVGIISIKATTGGGGSTFGSIGVSTVRGDTPTLGDGMTLWAHHYIPVGRTMYITGVTTGNCANTSLGSGGVFHLKSKNLGVANAMEIQITDHLHQFGQNSSMTRSYLTPIDIVGPARVTAFVLPDASLTGTYLASFDFYEDVSL